MPCQLKIYWSNRNLGGAAAVKITIHKILHHFYLNFKVELDDQFLSSIHQFYQKCTILTKVISKAELIIPEKQNKMLSSGKIKLLIKEHQTLLQESYAHHGGCKG